MSAVPDETIVLRDKFVPHGRTVPTENGWTWIAAAWSIFRRAAGIWIGMVLTLAVIYTVLAVLPVIGAIASFVVGPVFTAGLVLTSRTIDQGGEVQFSQLFGGFKYRFGTLLVVGLLYLAGTAAIVFVVVLMTGVSLFAPESLSKQFQLLSELVPQTKVIALVTTGSRPFLAAATAEVEAAVHRLRGCR